MPGPRVSETCIAFDGRLIICDLAGKGSPDASSSLPTVTLGPVAASMQHGGSKSDHGLRQTGPGAGPGQMLLKDLISDELKPQPQEQDISNSQATTPVNSAFPDGGL